jgi:hypothetical protein
MVVGHPVAAPHSQPPIGQRRPAGDLTQHGCVRSISHVCCPFAARLRLGAWGSPRLVSRAILSVTRLSLPSSGVSHRGLIEDVYGARADEVEEVKRVRAFELFEPAPLPDGVVRGTPNKCSVTAMATAFFHDLALVHGYALFDRRKELRDPDATPVWIGHWWAATENRQVVDASWEDPGIAYLGERIAVRKLDEGLAAYTLRGDVIADLGVYVYAPAALVDELERKRSATGDDLEAIRPSGTGRLASGGGALVAGVEVWIPLAFHDCEFDSVLSAKGAHIKSLELSACELVSLEADGFASPVGSIYETRCLRRTGLRLDRAELGGVRLRG